MSYTNKIVIGLTGHYCSGKSTVEKILKNEHDFYIIDVDKIGHWALEAKKKELVNKFGSIIIKENKINRKVLGEIVFKNKKDLFLLNSIVHPVMVEKVKEEISKKNNVKICINAAILFEMNLNKFCSCIFIIKSSFFNILKRAVKRDRASLIRIFRILSNQKVLNHTKKAMKSADICYINNNGNIEDLKNKIKYILLKRKIV